MIYNTDPLHIYEKIEFPLFCLSMVPNKIIYDKTKTYIQLHSGSPSYLVDNRALPFKDYAKRYSIIGKRYIGTDSTFAFSVTYLNLESFIRNKKPFGIDNKANIFYFEHFKDRITYKKIIDVKQNYIWVKDISYPLEIPIYFNEIDIADFKFFKAGCLKYKNVWRLIDLDFSKDEKVLSTNQRLKTQ